MSNAAIRVGAFAWVSALQFFVAQVVVARAWFTPFSLASGYISDLGNTSCTADAVGASAVICSPLHAVMNASFIAIGVTMALGGVLARPAFSGVRGTLAVVLFSIAGVGVVLVGVYPENVSTVEHTLGAGLNFICGNIALVLFGLSFRGKRRALLAVSVIAGLVGLAGTILFGTGYDLDLGVGTMERIAAYPMPIWQIVVGAALLRRPAA